MGIFDIGMAVPNTNPPRPAGVEIVPLLGPGRKGEGSESSLGRIGMRYRLGHSRSESGPYGYWTLPHAGHFQYGWPATRSIRVPHSRQYRTSGWPIGELGAGGGGAAIVGGGSWMTT